MTYIVDNDISIFFIAETWLTDLSNNTTGTIKSYGYKIIHKPRSVSDLNKSRGGGVAIVFKSNLNLVQVHLKHGTSFESVSAKLKSESGDNISYSCMYRTGPVSKLFFEEFDEFIASIFLKFTKILICGDINIHLDENCTDTSQFTELISAYGLTQHINEPTHNKGHTLDIVISSHKILKKTNIIQVCKSDSVDLFPSCDHFPLKFSMSRDIVSCKTEALKPITFRNVKLVDPTVFKSDLTCAFSSEFLVSKDGFAESIESYDKICLEVLNNHAPLLHKTIKDRRSAEWFDGEYKSLRTLRQRAEKKWRKSKLPSDKESYKELVKECNKLASDKKKKFYSSHFEKHSYSPKSLFHFVDHFLDQDKSLVLPPGESLPDTVEKFNQFFQDKITKIRQNFKEIQETPLPSDQNQPKAVLESFRPTTADEIHEILKDITIKSSTVDPLPAELLKDNLDTVVPHLCELVNLSLSQGCVDGAKVAHITPLIKDQTLDNSEFKNYRPISNLSFVGKLIERVVLRRLNEHLTENNLHIPWQSGYKKSHSTETLLIRIVNDLLIASNEEKATVVMMLDLSAAFDTVDHQLLLQILATELGITGTALNWFRSFLSGRCQRVKIGQYESVEIVIKFGVPQGSVLGPVLFNIYIRALYRSVQKLQFLIQGYADDHQVYKPFSKLSEYSILVNEVPQCFQSISQWMANHFLQLNPGKTEIIVFGSPSVLRSLTINGTFLGPNSNICIRFKPVVKNLGFWLDRTLSFTDQVNKVKSSCFLKLRNIAKMKSYLTVPQMRILVQAVILSKLDYCNSLYFGCTVAVIRQLQVIQNRACRVIFGMSRTESVNQKLKDMHWLKVNERIEFKLLLLVFKSVNGLAPHYLNELIVFNNDSGLRRKSLHSVNPYDSNNRAFQIAAPALWNRLPAMIRDSETVDIFKCRLKTHLFKRCFDC